MLNRTFLTIGLAFIFAGPSFAQTQPQSQATSPLQQCRTGADCTIAESRCGTHQELLPLNRSLVGAFSSLAEPLCAVDVMGAQVGTLRSACVSGVCSIETAAADPVLLEPEENYSAVARGVAEELEFTVPADDTDGRFTAYDLPPPIVEMETLGQIVVD